MEHKMSNNDRAYKKVFEDFLRFGDGEKLRMMQTKAVTYDDIGNAAAQGGYLIRPAMSEYIDLFIKDTEPMFELVTKDYSKRNRVNFITDTDDFTSYWSKDGAAINPLSSSSKPTFSQKKINKAMLYCNIHVNINVINDPIVDLEQFLVDSVARSFARARTKGILFGDGVVMNGLNNGFTPSSQNPQTIIVSGKNDKIPYPAGGQTPKTPTDNSEKIQLDVSSITYDDVLKLYYSLDDQYIKNASFVMSKETLANIRTLKDLNNNYLWSPANACFAQDTILGVPVARVQDMDDEKMLQVRKKFLCIWEISNVHII